MVRDAEAHADEDRKFQELVESRNRADAMIHATRKALDDEAIKVEAGEKEAIEAAIKDLEAVLKGDDKAAIDAKTEVLAKASSKIGERMYQNAGAEAGAEQAQASGEAQKPEGDFVDAEFEEVKDKK